MSAMTEYTWDSDLVSDLHKEAHGFRPSKDFFNRWQFADADARQEIWDTLIIIAGRALEPATCFMAEELAAEEFENRVSSTIAFGAKDRTQAIEWIMAAEGCDSINELEWKMGLKYGYLYLTKESNELTPQESLWLEAIDNGDTHAD